MSLFERVKNKRYDLQEKRKFPGDESGAYKQAKDDLEARKGFKKNKPGGLKADEKNPFVKRSVRKSRVDKLGGDIYDSPKFSQKGFEKSLKKSTKGPRTNIVDPFGKGDTPGQQKVKAMDKKAFKLTQPKDVTLPKSFTDFSKKIKKYRVDRDIERKIENPKLDISKVIKKRKSETPVQQSIPGTGGNRNIKKTYNKRKPRQKPPSGGGSSKYTPVSYTHLTLPTKA